jgi:hypothetical protein
MEFINVCSDGRMCFFPTSDVGYGLPSLKATAAQLTICHLHKRINLHGYKGTMTRSHILTIIDKYNRWHVEADRPPTLRSLVRIQRDANTHPHGFLALTLTNLIATTLRTHFQSQDDSRSTTHRQQTTLMTYPLQYQQAHNNLKPRSTHLSLLNRLTSLWKPGITEWSQVALRATRIKLILKPAAHIKSLEGVGINISTPIHVFHAVPTESTNTAHNRCALHPRNPPTHKPRHSHTPRGSH